MVESRDGEVGRDGLTLTFKQQVSVSGQQMDL